MRRFALLACLVASAACKGDPKGKPTPPAENGSGSAGSGSAVAEAPKGDPCAKAETKGSIAWIEDDYPSALACAKQKKVPLVLDLWAPWCHTCISMQTTVFMDPSFATDNSKFVFAALDTDREENAVPVGKFAPSAWPTFYVVSDDEQVLARFVGAATLDQFHEFLDSGTRAKIGSIEGGDARMLGAERALAKKDYQTAEEELTAAIAAAPTAWLRRAEVIWMLQMTKQKKNDIAGCVTVSDTYMDEVGQTAIATNFWSAAIDCASEQAKASPADKAIAAKTKSVIDRAMSHLEKAVAAKETPLSKDDWAEAMGFLRDALDAQGKKAEAKKISQQLETKLASEMHSAKTPFEAMQFIWPRADNAVYLGKPLELVPDYEKLAGELPKEYDPRARLGWIYLKANKPAEAAKWTDEALALVYGPRKGRLLTQRADIAALAGDKTAERKFREEAVKLWESLPDGQKSPDNLDNAKAALAAMDAGSGTGSGSAK